MNDVATIIIRQWIIISDSSCALGIARLGEIEREKARIATTKAEVISAATKALEDEATALLAEETPLRAGIRTYCDRNKLRLAGSVQHAEFATGSVEWERGRLRTEIDEEIAGPKLATLRTKAVKALATVWFGRFIEMKLSLAPAKIKAATDPEKARLMKSLGVSFPRGEDVFRILPAGAELADRPEAGD